MEPEFDIKFLSNEDFDNMPVSDRLGEDVSDSWGVYNPYTRQVRIRDTGFWEVNKYLLDHELEHAVEEHATDQGPNGLRHKKGKKFWKEILMPVMTGYNGQTKTWSPLGAFGHPSTDEKNAQRDAKNMQESSFGGLGFGMPGGDVSTPSFGSGVSPFSGQQATQGGLNQGLNSQTTNPLAEDPYARYGQQGGRLRF